MQTRETILFYFKNITNLDQNMEYKFCFTIFRFNPCLHTVGNFTFSVNSIITLSQRFFHPDRNKILQETQLCAAVNASVSRRIGVYDHMCLQYGHCSQAKLRQCSAHSSCLANKQNATMKQINNPCL